MVLYIKYVFSALIIINFASMAYGIHCNVCNFLSNSTCGDPYELNDVYKHQCNLYTVPQYIQDLSPGKHLVPTGCIKKVFQQDDETVVQRSCYWGNLSNTKIVCEHNPVLPNLEQLSCDVCDTEMCNSSNAIGSIVTTVALFFVLARIVS